MSDLSLRTGFLTSLDARKIGPRTWRLLAPLRYASVVLGRVVEVPTGFTTDFDSIPRWLPITYALLANRIQEEATVHDYLYRDGAGATQQEADAVLYEAMQTEGEPWGVRWPIWAGVRLGGWASFHRITLGLAVALLLIGAGCTATPQRLPPLTPSATCDFRMIDHNRRACAERGKTFTDPVPGSASCGECR